MSSSETSKMSSSEIDNSKKVTVHHYNGSLKYKGQMLKGKYHGKGSLYFDGYHFIGHFTNGKIDNGALIKNSKNKKIIIYFKDNIGTHYVNNKKRFVGKIDIIGKTGRKLKIKYIKGRLYYKNGKTKYYGNFYYENELKNFNKYNGYGKLYYKNGKLKYKGNFYNNKYHGVGKLYYKSGILKGVYRFNKGKIDKSDTADIIEYE